jgi:death on curing protein
VGVPDREGTRYVTYEHYLLAAAEALGADTRSVAAVVYRGLAESALAAPAAGFGDHEEYPAFEVKCAVLLQRVASNHALPDGNKRTALLCAILFANLNGLAWEPPTGDGDDGHETAEVVEAAAARGIPMPALTAWVAARLVPVPTAPHESEPTAHRLTTYPAEYLGPLHYTGNTIQVGDVVVRDVHGYNPAAVYVRRISGKTEGISIAQIVISVIGDGLAQEELDAENMEAARYPLGRKEFWRERMVGKYRYGDDSHLLTNAEFEADWEADEQP